MVMIAFTGMREDAAPTVGRAGRDDGGVPHVVIVGGGFGGLYAAKALRKAPVRITLVDRNNHHLFQPLLYQVATASLSPGEIASPIRGVLERQKNAEVWLAEAVGIDVEGRTLQLADGVLRYDYLIVASGATHTYFGRDGWEARAPGLKTVDDALELRRRIFLAFETAEREADPEARRRLLTFLIVGGGPTGVELAGALAEIARESLPRRFRFIDTSAARVILAEGAPHVLSTYPETLSEAARRQLERLGVEVRTGAAVTEIDGGGARIGGERIDAANVFWAAGVKASPLGRSTGAAVDRAGRVRVAPDLSLPGHPEVFVVGDLASVESGGKRVPGVAPAAMQMGRFAAAAIRRELAGKPRGIFRYHDKGSLATIGRAAAVADFGRVRLSGPVAWLLWVLIHIVQLAGFRNRAIVLTQWAWAWATRKRGIQLITGAGEMHLSRARDPIQARRTAEILPVSTTGD
jgi:NADH dehydrogenase